MDRRVNAGASDDPVAPARLWGLWDPAGGEDGRGCWLVRGWPGPAPGPLAYRTAEEADRAREEHGEADRARCREPTVVVAPLGVDPWGLTALGSYAEALLGDLATLLPRAVIEAKVDQLRQVAGAIAGGHWVDGRERVAS